MRKRFFASKLAASIIGVLLMVGSAQAKEYEVDPGHSAISFGIRHLVTTVNGRFKDFSGTIDFNEKNPERSKINFSVKAASITTENSKRDEDLRSSNFFSVENYPDATFASTEITPMGKNKATVTGNLTVHGITKKVTLDVEYSGAMRDPWGNLRAGFSATTILSRKDFGIVWNKALDNGGLLLGDDVRLKVDVEAVAK